MSELVACAGCRRHVFERQPSCPFCGARVVPGPAPLRFVGKLTRAALVYGAATLATAAT